MGDLLGFSAAASAPRFVTASTAIRATASTAFPYATLLENGGSLVMGMLVAVSLSRRQPQHWQLFLTTGILGGYTTFSTFSLDIALLYERGEIGLAAPMCCCR